ncbi:hypothetical protein RIR_jg12300.t1 [Rhizophagus irregularis DAOM 181602=DAOM 197198]|nr:hypothetical protein RIR_jg12300.t1 [Rhizophagus irregularis DAOM 181602=DAOM 197198]
MELSFLGRIDPKMTGLTRFGAYLYSTSPDSFISSALLVKHRSIVFNRVLVVIDSKPTLLTDLLDIKQTAIKLKL